MLWQFPWKRTFIALGWLYVNTTALKALEPARVLYFSAVIESPDLFGGWRVVRQAADAAASLRVWGEMAHAELIPSGV
jgi:hypothetical protein